MRYNPDQLEKLRKHRKQQKRRRRHEKRHAAYEQGRASRRK